MNRLEYESLNPFEVSEECRMPFRRRIAEAARELIGPVPICATFAVCLWWGVNRGMLRLRPAGGGWWATPGQIFHILNLQCLACVALALATAAFALLLRRMNNLRHRPLRLGMIFGAILMAAMLIGRLSVVGSIIALQREWRWNSLAFLLFCLPLFAGIHFAKHPEEHPAQ